MEIRPKLDLPKSSLERWIDVASWIFVMLGFVLALNSYSDLPDLIPHHFNAAGEADRYGSKEIIFLMPIIAFVTVAGMMFMTRFPHKFNYLNTITPENAAFEYERMRVLLRVTYLLVSLLMLTLTWNLIQSTQDHTAKLGAGFWVLIALIMIAPWLILLLWKKKPA